MSSHRTLNVALLALTGFGNTVLEALLGDARVRVGAVFTAGYDKPFPYYPERPLPELCDERRIRYYHDLEVCAGEGMGRLCDLAPDLIIVATFEQILRENILGLPPLGVVNFHPSLLPRYRGRCPTNAALFNDERVTGVTVHYVTKQLDGGDILLQRAIAINSRDTDGQLRRTLARLAGSMVPSLIGMFASFTKPAGRPQDHSLASPAPKPAADAGYLERATDVDTIRRMMRAFNPLPGTSIGVGGRRVTVDRFELFRAYGPTGLHEYNDAIELITGPQAIRLFKKVR